MANLWSVCRIVLMQYNYINNEKWGFDMALITASSSHYWDLLNTPLCACQTINAMHSTRNKLKQHCLCLARFLKHDTNLITLHSLNLRETPRHAAPSSFYSSPRSSVDTFARKGEKGKKNNFISNFVS